MKNRRLLHRMRSRRGSLPVDSHKNWIQKFTFWTQHFSLAADEYDPSVRCDDNAEVYWL